MNSLDYLLRSTLYLLLFAGCYQLLLRRTTFFALNRAYLLAALALSLVLPFVEWPGSRADALPAGVISLPVFTTGAPAPASGLTTGQLLWSLYGLGVLAMLVRLGVRLRLIYRLIGQGTHYTGHPYTLVQLPHDTTASFSFWRYLVLNRTDAQAPSPALLRHEEAHIRQRHTLDILFVELVQAGLWFNPLLWGYRLALQEVHEFLADRAAASASQPDTDPADYAHQLVAYALDVPTTVLTTPFASFSTLKQRIIMLQKPRSPRTGLLGYTLVLPLAALLLMCTQNESDKPTTQADAATASARKPVKVDGEIYMVVEQQPEFPGGVKALNSYLSQNLKYPEHARKQQVEGKVFVQFVVTKTGEIADVSVLKGIGYGADAEAVRVVQQMPRWIPGKQDNTPINVRYNLPINFQLRQTSGKNPFPGIDHFMINGNAVSREAIQALDPDQIIRVDVDKEQGTLSATVKR